MNYGGVSQVVQELSQGGLVPEGIGFLGPRGTFTEEALRSYLGCAPVPVLPYPTLPEVVQAVQGGKVAAGLVPIENSLEGSVNLILDLLAHETDLLIKGEVAMPIHHFLLGPKGSGREGIRTVLSHPQALAQCRGFLAGRLPRAHLRPVESTGRAVVLTAAAGEEGLAAIGTRLAGRLYGLDIIAENIEDRANNMTRFVLLGRGIPSPTGCDRTSLVFTTAHQPGCLYRVLGEFAGRGLNLTKIESRPAKHTLGEYIFFVDIEGHREDLPVAQALDIIQSQCTFYKFLGSYPQWKQHM